MFEGTFYSSGKNIFDNNTFSDCEWSAHMLVSPADIRTLIDSFELEGRRISRLKMIGLAYNLDRDSIEERAYHYYDKLGEEDDPKKYDFPNIDPAIPYSRFAEIDEPFLIEFDNGDVFEICTPWASRFRISMNCIPWDIEAGTNQPNADANVLFAPCIGRTIASVEAKSYETDIDPATNHPFDEDESTMELVSSVILTFDDGASLSVKGWYDFCHITYTDAEGCEGTIPFGELRPALFGREEYSADWSAAYESAGS